MKNEKQWDISRAAYVAYREAKRKLNQICKEHTRTFYRLERAFRQYSYAKFEAETQSHDPTQAAKLIEAYKTVREAKQEHDASRVTFGETWKEFQKIERQYSVQIFKGLRNEHDLKVADLARIFGVYNNQIARWLRGGSDAEIAKMYNEEFNVSPLLDEDEDE